VEFQKHTVPVEVIFADTDAMGIVYYANYLRFFEVGRTAYVQRFAEEITAAIVAGEGLFYPVTQVVCRYRKPARVYDRLQIDTCLSKVNRASFAFAYRIGRESDGALLVEGETEHACIDGSGRILRFDARMKAFFSRAAADAAPIIEDV
jgi:acyl-CoA thioester hydrolase